MAERVAELTNLRDELGARMLNWPSFYGALGTETDAARLRWNRDSGPPMDDYLGWSRWPGALNYTAQLTGFRRGRAHQRRVARRQAGLTEKATVSINLERPR